MMNGLFYYEAIQCIVHRYKTRIGCIYIIYYIFMEGHILTVSCCILFLLKSYIMNESDL